EHAASWGGVQLAGGRREVAAGGGRVGVEPDLGAVGPGAERQGVHDVGDRVEAVRRDEAAGQLGGGGDPVDAVRAQRFAQVVVADEVPAAGVHDQAVRVDVACGAHAVRPGVVDPDPATGADGGGEGQGQLRFGGGRDVAAGGDHRRGGEQRVDAFAQRTGQDAGELDQRAVGRRRLGGVGAV